MTGYHPAMPGTRVAFLTCHLPYPPLSGGRRREYELLKRLRSECEIHLCAVSKTYDEDVRNASAISQYCESLEIFPAAPEPEPGQHPTLCYQERRHRCAEIEPYLTQLLDAGAVDLVHVEGFYLMQHVVDPCPVPIFLVEQNVEYVLWRQRTETAIRRKERQRFLHEYLTTVEAEIAAWNRSALCGAVTEDDRQIIQAAAPELDVRVVPDGADHLLTPGRSAPGAELVASIPRGFSVGFVANFAYQPNVDAALYLAREIFPRVRAHVPAAQLFLVGNAPPPEIERLSSTASGILVTGRVPAVEPYIDAVDVIVCPLRIGGGVKVKLLEALSRGKAIVTTSVGTQGLGQGVTSAVDVQDEPLKFADAVARLLMKTSRRRELEKRARAFAATLPTWDTAAALLADCYREVLGQASGAKSVPLR